MKMFGMAHLRARGEEIRGFILEQVEDHPADIAQVVAKRFGISRQAVSLHLKRLVDQRALTAEGNTRNRTYHVHNQNALEKFMAGMDSGVQKVIVPVNFICHSNEMLVSRAQAGRLLSRMDRFRIVILDFQGIGWIGHAFADEVFRVFKHNKPDIQLYFVNAVQAVQNIIIHVLDVDCVDHCSKGSDSRYPPVTIGSTKDIWPREFRYESSARASKSERIISNRQ